MKFFACFTALISAGLNTAADNVTRDGKTTLRWNHSLWTANELGECARTQQPTLSPRPLTNTGFFRLCERRRDRTRDPEFYPAGAAIECGSALVSLVFDGRTSRREPTARTKLTRRSRALRFFDQRGRLLPSSLRGQSDPQFRVSGDGAVAGESVAKNTAHFLAIADARDNAHAGR